MYGLELYHLYHYVHSTECVTEKMFRVSYFVLCVKMKSRTSHMCYSDAMDINALERGEHNSKYLYYRGFFSSCGCRRRGFHYSAVTLSVQSLRGFHYSAVTLSVQSLRCAEWSCIK